MKSKQSEKTNCEECIFAVLSPVLNVQIGCHANRLDTFCDRKEADNGDGSLPHFQLNRFCNMRRDDGWRVEVQKKYTESFDTPNHSFVEDLVDIACSEVMPVFGIAVQDHPNSTLEDLQTTLKSVMDMKYPGEKMRVVISTFSGRGLNNTMHEVNVLKENGIDAQAIFHVVFDPKIKDTEVFKKLVQTHYFVNVFSGAKLDPDLFININESINENMEKIAMFERRSEYNVIGKQFAINLYLNFNNYEDMTNHIRTISQENNVYREV